LEVASERKANTSGVHNRVERIETGTDQLEVELKPRFDRRRF